MAHGIVFSDAVFGEPLLVHHVDCTLWYDAAVAAPLARFLGRICNCFVFFVGKIAAEEFGINIAGGSLEPDIKEI